MGCLRYDGTNDRGTVAYNAAYEPAAMTMGALIRIPTGASNANFNRLIDFHTGAAAEGYTLIFTNSGASIRPFLYQGFTGIGSEFTFTNDVWFWAFLLSNTTGPANSFWTGTLGGTVTQSGASETSTTRATGGGASVFALGAEGGSAANWGQFDLARMFVANVILTEQELNSICYGASPINVLQARGALNVYYDMRPNFSGQPDLGSGLDIAHGGATWMEGPSNLLEPVDSFPLVLPYNATTPTIRVHPVGIGKGRGGGKGGGNPNQPPTQIFVPIPPGVMGFESTSAPYTPDQGGNPTLLSEGVYWHTGIFSGTPHVGSGWSSTTNLTDGSSGDTTTRETSGDDSISILTVGAGAQQLDQLIATLRYKGNIAEVYKEWTGSAYEDIPIDIAAAFPPNATYTDGSGTTIFDTNSETIRLYQFTESDTSGGGMSASDIRETLS